MINISDLNLSKMPVDETYITLSNCMDYTSSLRQEKILMSVSLLVLVVLVMIAIYIIYIREKR